MASGTHAASNGDLAFVARCSVSKLFVASASYDLTAYQFRRHYRICWKTPSDCFRPVCLSANQGTYPQSL